MKKNKYYIYGGLVAAVIIVGALVLGSGNLFQGRLKTPPNLLITPIEPKVMVPTPVATSTKNKFPGTGLPKVPGTPAGTPTQEPETTPGQTPTQEPAPPTEESLPTGNATVAAPPLLVSCSPSSTWVTNGQEVKWTSTVSGGVPPYSYNWVGSGVQGQTGMSAIGPATMDPTLKTIDSEVDITLKVKDASGNIQSNGCNIRVFKTTPASTLSVSAAPFTTDKILKDADRTRLLGFNLSNQGGLPLSFMDNDKIEVNLAGKFKSKCFNPDGSATEAPCSCYLTDGMTDYSFGGAEGFGLRHFFFSINSLHLEPGNPTGNPPVPPSVKTLYVECDTNGVEPGDYLVASLQPSPTTFTWSYGNLTHITGQNVITAPISGPTFASATPPSDKP
jgi:hypothetical protein